MKKAILISIKPKYVEDILNGTKTIEIRKTCPKCDLPIDVYIYCSKSGPILRGLSETALLPHPRMDGKSRIRFEQDCPVLNGKVVAKFTLNKVEEIEKVFTETYYTYCTKDLEYNELFGKSCLELFELEKYLNEQTGYAWYIDNLKIFDKPKELSEFMPIKWNKCGVKDKNGLYQCHKCPYGEVLLYGVECHYKPLKRSPQSYCFVESLDE